MAVVEPHEVRRSAVGSADLEDLAVTVGLADLLAVDDEAFADAACIVAPPDSFQRTPGPGAAEGIAGRERGARDGAGAASLARVSRVGQTSHFSSPTNGEVPMVDARHARVPARIPLGCGDRRVPGRGRDPRRRPRRLGLGRVRAHARPRARRVERRRRGRQLPSLARRRGPPRRARRRRLPLLDRLAAGAADRRRAGQRGGAGPLRPARRRAARRGHPAPADALPLGPAAAARGRGRMARTRHRRPLRRLRRARARPARRPRADAGSP